MRTLLPNKSIHNNHDIFYDETALIFFMNTIVMRKGSVLVLLQVYFLGPVLGVGWL